MKKKNQSKRDELINKLKSRKINDVDEIKNFRLEILNPLAAGGDISSSTIYVCIPPQKAIELNIDLVHVFGCFTQDLYKIRDLLVLCMVTTFAMESTSVYWIPLYDVLTAAGIEVCLVNPKKYRMIPGRKNDTDDAIWLQTLHSYGLLQGSFHPEPNIKALRTLTRTRDIYVKESVRFTQRMQKCMTEMNILLHNVIDDIMGETGMKIIEAIISGERDPEKLAKHRNYRIKSSEEEIVKSLQGNWKNDQLIVLQINYESYKHTWQQIRKIDEEIEKMLLQFPLKKNYDDKPPTLKRSKTVQKNNPQLNTPLDKHLFAITGVDLTRIDGIGSQSVLQIIAEVGTDLSAFPTENHFASYLGLTPRTDISNGKVLRSRTARVKSTASLVFRKCVIGLANSKTSLGAFYRRMRGRLGKLQANVATARKIAIIFYRMIVHGQDYIDVGEKIYLQKQEERRKKSLIKTASKLGLRVINNDGEILA
jgi:transposase